MTRPKERSRMPGRTRLAHRKEPVRLTSTARGRARAELFEGHRAEDARRGHEHVDGSSSRSICEQASSTAEASRTSACDAQEVRCDSRRCRCRRSRRSHPVRRRPRRCAGHAPGSSRDQGDPPFEAVEPHPRRVVSGAHVRGSESASRSKASPLEPSPRPVAGATPSQTTDAAVAPARALVALRDPSARRAAPPPRATKYGGAAAVRRGPRAAAPCAAGPAPAAPDRPRAMRGMRRALQLDLAVVAGHVHGEERDPVLRHGRHHLVADGAARGGAAGGAAGDQAAEEGERLTAGLGAALARAAGQRHRSRSTPHTMFAISSRMSRTSSTGSPSWILRDGRREQQAGVGRLHALALRR